MRIRALAISLTALLLLGVFAVGIAMSRPLPAADTAALNDLRARAAEAWPEVNAETFPQTAPPLTVVDARGSILYSSSPELYSELSANAAHAHVLPLVRGDKYLGAVMVESTRESEFAAQRTNVLAITLAVFTVIALCIVGGLVWLWIRTLRPFRRLQDFARELARGNLDSPLPMDRGNAFGAFSESFDLMRSELRRARDAERATREQTRETLAQIGHDLRTPVAIIAATNEVLAIEETDPDQRARLDTIDARTAQIARLLDDLIDTNENDLGALTVVPLPTTNSELAELIRSCDTEGTIEPFTLPECVVDIDPERTRQVFDNLLSNSRKFAGTPVTIDAQISSEPSGHAGAVLRSLQLTFSDEGPGVSDQDLSMIIAQGVRGSNAEGVPGSGLGLYIAARLIEQMGGELAVVRRRPGTGSSTGSGFAVTITLPLSGDT